MLKGAEHSTRRVLRLELARCPSFSRLEDIPPVWQTIHRQRDIQRYCTTFLWHLQLFRPCLFSNVALIYDLGPKCKKFGNFQAFSALANQMKRSGKVSWDLNFQCAASDHYYSTKTGGFLECCSWQLSIITC